jgi:hypothetical protein
MILLMVALSFPFLAVDEPSGARTAVVEGWIPQDLMPAVKRVLDEHGYDHIYTTGTPRNCTHTFRLHDTLDIELAEPVKGGLVLNACGANGAGFKVIADTTVILEHRVAGVCIDHRAEIRTPAKRIRITPTFDGIAKPEWELLFTLFVKFEGKNINAIQRSVVMRTAQGVVAPGLPTYADVAANALMKAGFAETRITALPSYTVGESRTVSNARRFAQQAKSSGITQVDVISLGVHARRSRLAYREACGAGVVVGIVSVDDPELQRGRWWLRLIGWYKVVKELIGVPATYLIDDPK